MEIGRSSGPTGQAIEQGIQAGTEQVLEDQMMGALKVPVKAGDNEAAQSRFQDVRDLAGKMSPEHAGQLLDQLNTKNSKDPLAKEIKYKFSDASVDKLKQDLAVKSGRANEPQTQEPKTTPTVPSKSEKQTRKAETNLEGQVKAADMLASLRQSELEKKMENKADNIFRASDVMHKNPHAIRANLHGLTKDEGQALASVWQKKYGTSFDVHLQKELKGQDLETARDLVAGRTQLVDQKDASKRTNQLMHAFDASPVNNKAVLENLQFLTTDQQQMIKKMFQERYGQNLDSLIREKLTGDDQSQALHMLNDKPVSFPAIPMQ